MTMSDILISLAISLFAGVLIFLLGRFWEFIPRSIKQLTLQRFFGWSILKNRSAIVYGTLEDPRPKYDARGKALPRFRKKFYNGRTVDVAGPYEDIVGGCEIRSASYLAQTFGRFRKRDIKILSDIEAYGDFDYTLISLGSPASNQISDFIMRQKSNVLCRFRRENEENFIEFISDGRKFKGFQPPARKDIAVIMRLQNCRFSDKFLFVCGGLCEWGTSGASWYLANRWEELNKEFGKRDFAIIVEVEIKSDTSARRIA